MSDSKKIAEAISYYSIKREEIIRFMNDHNDLSAEEIIQKGEELAVLESKLTALEVAREN
ncbi:hypothetical protein [Gaetbulibacter aestuarii]|uniref:Uncharacterized protein n=1 Tax=Gaetbulibacter aestuarii TaxID=1502358 RepID=A0ABW7MVS5_9FLAO